MDNLVLLTILPKIYHSTISLYLTVLQAPRPTSLESIGSVRPELIWLISVVTVIASCMFAITCNHTASALVHPPGLIDSESLGSLASSGRI